MPDPKTTKPLNSKVLAAARRAAGQGPEGVAVRSAADQVAQAAAAAGRVAEKLARTNNALAPSRIILTDAAKPSKRKFNAARQAKYLDLLRQGLRRTDAAKGVGVHSSLVRNARRDPVFLREELNAEEEATDQLEDVLWQMAKDGDREAIFYWLGNRAKDRWINTKVQKHVVSGGVTHEHDIGPRIERIRALEARLEERAAAIGVGDVIDVAALDNDVK